MAWNGFHVARDMESWWSLVECGNKILVLVKFGEFIDLRRNQCYSGAVVNEGSLLYNILNS